MDWIQYVIMAVLIFFVIRKLLPVKGLTNLRQDEVLSLLEKRSGITFVDVREVFEYKSGHIKHFQNIPLSVLEKRLHELDRNQSIVLTCKSGMRSRQAAKILLKNGFNNVSHLHTGVAGWNGSLVK